MNEKMVRRIIVAVALGTALAGCSSSGPSAARTAPSGAATTAAADPAQMYLDTINGLCDALLPKVIAATHGGSIDVPAREYLASWPAHKQLLDDFDAHVATVSVPATAHDSAAALTGYVRFADQLDTRRLAAAHSGQAAYAKEVESESGVDNDPTIAALTAAGFNKSCTAR